MASCDKATRGHRRASVTRSIGALRRLMLGDSADGINAQVDKLTQAFSDFESTHDTIHNSQDDAKAILDSEIYLCEVDNAFIDVISQSKKWVNSQVHGAKSETCITTQM